MKEYFVAINEEQKGPYSLEEIKALGILPTTLIWTEELKDWTEAREVPELGNLFKKMPPPIPKKSEKVYKVEAEIKKEKKEKLITPETEVATAKEIKANFGLAIVGALIGLVSFPIFFSMNGGNDQFNMYNKWESFSERHYGSTSIFDYNREKTKEELLAIDKEKKKLERESELLGWRNRNSTIGGGSIQIPATSSEIQKFHKFRYESEAENAMEPSTITGIIAILVLIFGRYLLKGAKWVEKTSKKEL